jgi:hypothetical protein
MSAESPARREPGNWPSLGPQAHLSGQFQRNVMRPYLDLNWPLDLRVAS